MITRQELIDRGFCSNREYPGEGNVLLLRSVWIRHEDCFSINAYFEKDILKNLTLDVSIEYKIEQDVYDNLSTYLNLDKNTPIEDIDHLIRILGL